MEVRQRLQIYHTSIIKYFCFIHSSKHARWYLHLQFGQSRFAMVFTFQPIQTQLNVYYVYVYLNILLNSYYGGYYVTCSVFKYCKFRLSHIPLCRGIPCAVHGGDGGRTFLGMIQFGSPLPCQWSRGVVFGQLFGNFNFHKTPSVQPTIRF